MNRTISVNVENEAISSILNHLFSSEDVEYGVKGKQIVFSPKEKTEISTQLLATEQQQGKTITSIIVDE